MNIKFKSEKNISALALGAESAGNFSVYDKGKIFLSEDFGDLLEETNFKKFKVAVLRHLKENKIKPKAVLTDLHPLYKTTVWGAELAKKFGAEHVQIQHHLAHIFSAIGEKKLSVISHQPSAVFGIACDGTGYGLDGKIWGGEVFQVESEKLKVKSVGRIGHLENQIMIGGDLAIREPARMLLAILDKIQDPKIVGRPTSDKREKDFVYKFVKKYYTRNRFELLYSQMKQGFNCQETSSAGRVLDAVSVLLGFSVNERKYKHAPTMLLERNSTAVYGNLKPKITSLCNEESRIMNYELSTTPLFEYLIKNLNKDKRRLAATAQLYIAEGLYKMCQMSNACPQMLRIKHCRRVKCQIFFSGGMANNKIMSSYFESKGAVMNEKIPRGDGGLSFGQIVYHLLSKT